MRFIQILKLLAVYLIYSLTGICTKWASQGEFLSWQYILGIVGAVLVLGSYAILWQIILKTIPLTTAYLYKGTGVIFAFCYSYFIFGETITLNNILGAVIIIVGITLYSLEKSAK